MPREMMTTKTIGITTLVLILSGLQFKSGSPKTISGRLFFLGAFLPMAKQTFAHEIRGERHHWLYYQHQLPKSVCNLSSSSRRKTAVD